MVASVLTNSSAMVALQTLRSTNANLEDVNAQISTGKKVATAKDSAAVFAISKIMESDVAGFKALEESLALGESTVAVASNAAGSIGDLLNEIKGKIVAANEDNVDRTALQNEITSLRDQITSIVDSAQFNGLNLIDGSSANFGVLSSLSRDASGNVTTGQVNLTTANTNLSAVGGLDVNGITAAGDAAGSDQSAISGGFDNTGFQVVATTATFSVDIDNIQGGAGALDPNDSANTADPSAAGLLAGDRVEVTVGSVTAAYTVRLGDIGEDVAAGLRTALIDAGIDTTDFTVATNGTALDITNNGTLEVRVDSSSSRGTGGLAALSGVDVTSAGGASTALGTIENLIQNATNAQAELGTVEKRLEIQSDFTSTLIDSFKAGIGALVDADLEEASARLQALQVQQQLGIQALSIANQAPQNILALFR
ncbi:MAG: flagellin [Pseudomonadota bacterium]